MKESVTSFHLTLPGFVTGMVLAGVVLLAAEVVFRDTFPKVILRQTFLILAVAIVVASVVGFVGIFLPSPGEEKPRVNLTSKSPSGGPDVS